MSSEEESESESEIEVAKTPISVAKTPASVVNAPASVVDAPASVVDAPAIADDPDLFGDGKELSFQVGAPQLRVLRDMRGAIDSMLVGRTPSKSALRAHGVVGRGCVGQRNLAHRSRRRDLPLFKTFDRRHERGAAAHGRGG